MDIVNYDSWLTLAEVNRNNYIWRPGITVDEDVTNIWYWQYHRVLTANLVLETLNKIKAAGAGEQARWDYQKGAAYFFRGSTNYHLVQYYAPPYDKAKAASLPGIPLRYSTDTGEKTVRPAMDESWKAIVSDLQLAAENLPEVTEEKTRPAKAAAYAYMARVWLAMGEYALAAAACDSCLKRNNKLLDFNTLNAASNFPMPSFSNDEMIFHSMVIGVGNLHQSRWRVDSALYASYEANDLRKTIYYRNNGDGYVFKGDMGLRGAENSGTRFNGPTVGEVLLIKAESVARLGDKDGALKTLNTLLARRWKTGTYLPKTAHGTQAALDTILVERRKELVMRSTRWFDLRRLNKEPRYSKKLTRILNGVVYELPPDDNRYTFLIPQPVILMSGIAQNPY